MKVDIFELIDACCEVYDDPAMKPKQLENGHMETYCNRAVYSVCAKLGYHKFYNKLANEIVDFMESHPEEWERIDMSSAQGIANSGRLVVAGRKVDGHGHVVIVRPGVEDRSSKWESFVPKVMNVGSQNSIGKSLNWVMAEKPNVYALR